MSANESGGAHQLWGGRFADGPAPELVAVNRSISVDFRLWPFDVRLSQAWAAALADAAVITAAESQQLIDGLSRVAARLHDGAQPTPSDEDIHTMIDRVLHEEAGTVASRLHTGRSRNDQVATATRLWVIDAAALLDSELMRLQRVMVARAEELHGVLMPAYTHLQRAQPILAAHWMLSHFWPLQRDRVRLAAAAKAASVLPLGSGAIAGSAFRISRASLGAALGFAAISENSMDAVSDRDFVADLLFVLALVGTHLSRLAEDLLLFGTSEFGFVQFADAFSTGSSMMPQKRNPDGIELARGSGARVLGNLTSLLATLKGLPTGYNKDLQEDKRVLFDAVDGMMLVLPAVAGTMRTLHFRSERMEAAVSSGMLATDVADYLVRKRVTFRDAHAAVGRLVREAEEKRCELSELPFNSYASAHAQFAPDVMAELSPRASLAHREIEGGTGPESVKRQIAAARAAVEGG